MRGPIKEQALHVIRDRGVPVSAVVDVGVRTDTPELREAFPKVRHYLFEPVAEFNDTITEAYRDVPHELHNAAVADQTGTTKLELFDRIEGVEISHSSMVAADKQGGVLRTVPMIALDDFFGGRPETDYLLKIDIDGHEMAVLRGAKEFLKKCSVVIIEVTKDNLVERVDALQKAGFDLFDLAEPCYYDQAFWQCDAVLIRKDVKAAHFEALGATVKPGLYTIYAPQHG